ncbi:GNAT family N-acetyltransferase [Hyphomicrobium sp.]|uniref:GNAT family N-acetyltransferase n=1 Tax=Hyphomicrobium sp. TaxID=82 RepID=UPI0025BBC63D|nr:GNAT family N-acetyltransferase [Hyphomicrobium sp.]MCC7251382.1 GNAT family N-acetyltransferase [Hyphomicrobium sp.]
MQIELERGLWRPMTTADMPAVCAVGDGIHVAYPEDKAVFVERLRLYPAGCVALELDSKLAGYAITHPWRYAEPPALNVMLDALPERATTYYIHDIALLPETRGSGAGSAIVNAVIAHAETIGVSNVSLVAVNGSVPFWSRFGFAVTEEPKVTAKLLTYDADARFMVRTLG